MTTHSQYSGTDRIIAQIHEILGHYPGFRTLHADGRFYRGTFRANAEARAYTRAAHLQGAEIPVTVRFSKGGGDPFAHFNATVGMATRFYLADGRVTNLVMLSQKQFIASSVEQFLGLLAAARPLEPNAGPNMKGLKEFLAANPNSAAVFQARAASPAPVSFAHTEFHSVHAFRYVSEAGHVTPARCHWTPVLGVRGRPAAELAAEPIDVLYRELDARLTRDAVAFDLVLELAEPGDPLEDATAVWPEGRRRIPIGRLTLTKPTNEDELADKVMNHDPTMLVDGIEATDDPILQIRRGVYELSAAQRAKAKNESK